MTQNQDRPQQSGLNQPLTSLEKVKSGRRKKQQTSRYLDTPMNPYFKIYEKLIEYLQSIGLIHGLCFTPDLRKSLQHHNKIPQIKWESHGKGWHYQDEVEYVKQDKGMMLRIRRIMFVIKARMRKQIKKDKILKEVNQECSKIKLQMWSQDKLIDLLIRPGQMVDGQCRHELYSLNISILQTIFFKKSLGKQFQNNFILSFLKNSKFFSRKFTSYKKKNWIEVKGCSQEDLQKKFMKMFRNFKASFKYILYEYDEWQLYSQDMKDLFEEVTKKESEE